MVAGGHVTEVSLGFWVHLGLNCQHGKVIVNWQHIHPNDKNKHGS